MDVKDGEFLVRLARRAISEHLVHKRRIKSPVDVRGELKEKRGVFVTLRTHPSEELRGCIGFPEPVKPLIDAVIDAAISSATGDPRFYPVSPNELSHISIEVTVLTLPAPVKSVSPQDRLTEIEIGNHGLMIEKGLNRGLLLPQVPIEQGWNKEEYLAGICMKAGLPANAWMEKDTKLYRFEGIIFSEKEPEGAVEEKRY